MSRPRINSYTNWSHLEEVWLGDCYPAHFYDHLESEVRDVFYEITEKTQADLAIIQRKLEEFGVQVQRPHYAHLDDYLDPRNQQLLKPQICPRDHFLVFGNRLYESGIPGRESRPWQALIDEYRQDPQCEIVTSIDTAVNPVVISSANAVRVGRDLYLDMGSPRVSSRSVRTDAVIQQQLESLFQDYRFHKIWNGGHIDGCFAVARPGLLITSSHYRGYDQTFPGWERIDIAAPEFQRHQPRSRKGPSHFGKWYVDPAQQGNRKFNEHIIKHASTWVGDYTETYFEVNCLVLNETNIMMLGNNETMARELERRGITVHWVPFRTRTFWDGGLHCITLDIRRRDHMIDLFPERGDQRVFEYANS